MRNNQRSKRSIPFAKIVIILLVISVGFGFLFDMGCTLIEKKTHPLKYTDYVEKYAEQYNVPRELIYAIIIPKATFSQMRYRAQEP